MLNFIKYGRWSFGSWVLGIEEEDKKLSKQFDMIQNTKRQTDCIFGFAQHWITEKLVIAIIRKKVYFCIKIARIYEIKGSLDHGFSSSFPYPQM